MAPIQRMQSYLNAAEARQLDGIATSVGLYIAFRARNGMAWPSQATIVKELRFARSTVQGAIDRLQAAGLIAVVTHGRGRVNLYTLTMEHSEDCSTVIHNLPGSRAPVDLSSPGAGQGSPGAGHDLPGSRAPTRRELDLTNTGDLPGSRAPRRESLGIMWKRYTGPQVMLAAQMLGVSTIGKTNDELFPALNRALKNAEEGLQGQVRALFAA